ncbi:TATA box-binding protein-associated factor RNA polymerase I subunit A isoform X3 [Callithrix jacchus]
MSDFSEELKGPVTDDEQVETSVLSGAGMHFPWLQTYIETVAIGGKRKKDFAQTASACLSFIQEALLKHQWQQAAEYMPSYFQTLEDSDSYKSCWNSMGIEMEPKRYSPIMHMMKSYHQIQMPTSTYTTF